MRNENTDLAALQRDISRGNPRAVYVFHGTESYLRDHYLKKLKECIVNPNLEAFNYICLEDDGISRESLVEAVEGLPVMAERKLVVVRDLNIARPSQEYKETLETILADLPDTTCLVFLFVALEYKPDARTKIHKRISSIGQIVEFAPQNTGALVSWMSKHFMAYGKKIDRSLCEYIIFLCGDLMSNLKNEIAKMAAYCHSDTITRADVDAVAAPVLDAVAYQLTEAVAGGAWNNAMSILMTLSEMRVETVGILAALGRNLRGLYAARLAMDSGRGARDVMRLMGYRSAYPAERLMNSARSRSASWCRRAISLCSDADRLLKTGSGLADRARLLEWVIAKLEQGA